MILDSAASLLKDARGRAGMTQTELGRAAGVTQSVVSAYESGQRQPSLAVLLRLIRASGHVLDASLVAQEGSSQPPAPMSGSLGRRLLRHRRELEAVAAAHGVKRLRVFGSVARGTEGPDSDIDLLVDLPGGTGLFTLGRLRRELEDLLKASVDLVPEDGLKPEVRQDIMADVVEL